MIDAAIAKELVENGNAYVKHVSMRDALGRVVTAKVLGSVLPLRPKGDDYFCLRVRRGVHAPFYIDSSNGEDWEPFSKE